MKNHWKLLTGIGLLFVLGMLLGVIGTALWIKHRHPFLGPPPPPGNPKAFILKRMTEELSLTDSQKERIDAILETIHGQMIARFQQHRQEEERVMAQTFDSIKRELTPEQVQKFETMKARFDENRKKHEKGFFPHPPPPPPEERP